MMPTVALAAPASPSPDPWLGCWTRKYDAAHLAKHPKQTVSAMSVHITPRKPDSANDTGLWAARIQVRFRDNPQLYKTPAGARCGKIGSLEKPFFLCFMAGDFNGTFNIDRTGSNDLKLYMAGHNHDFVVVPGTDKSAFVRISPQNPEHAVFLLRPAPVAACEQDLN